MLKFKFENVRGGPWCQTRLTYRNLCFITDELVQHVIKKVDSKPKDGKISLEEMKKARIEVMKAKEYEGERM